jgi:hypothetical protein
MSQLSDLGQFFQTGGQGDEVVAGKLAHLAGEMDAAIGQQDFGFADAARIRDDLPWGRVARMVLVADAEIIVA